MQALFGSAFSTPVNVEVSFTNVADRKYRDVVAASSGLPHRVYIFSDGDDVCGDVKVGVGGGKRLDHVGVKVELKGVIEVSGDKGGAVHEFTSLVRELAAPGSMTGLQSYSFRFPKAELPHESYDGINAVCRYYVKATVGRTATLAHAAKEADFTVQNPGARGALTAAAQPAAGDALTAATSAAAAADTSVKLEVGIEDCLHIEFEYDATSLGLDDDVTGRVHFLLVRIRIKTMELALVRRETVGGGPGGPGGGGAGATLESETLTRFELMDGCPVRGEVIPIRMPLAGLDLTPTLNTAAAASGGAGGGLFSVRYFLNLVLLDEEDRRYFKQQELVLHRREIETGAPTALAAGAGKGAAASS